MKKIKLGSVKNVVFQFFELKRKVAKNVVVSQYFFGSLKK